VELINDEISVQIVDTLKKTIVQAQTQAAELRENLQAITKEIEEHTRVRWLEMSHMSMLGACWRQAKMKKKGDFGKESMHEESDSWKEGQHACIQKNT
jgi:hypothetical protein